MTKVMNVIDKWFGATIKEYGFDFIVYIGFALAVLSIVLGVFSVNFEDLTPLAKMLSIDTETDENGADGATAETEAETADPMNTPEE